MDQSRFRPHQTLTRTRSTRWLTAGVVGLSLIQARNAEAQHAPTAPSGAAAICGRTELVRAVRTLIQFCPAGHCIPSPGVGDLLEQRVGADQLQRISNATALEPARVFYRTGRGRFNPDETISAAHFRAVQADLAQMVRTWSDFPGSQIVVLGRASQTGDVANNLRLSEQRAQGLASAIRAMGVPVQDIHRAYFGSQLFQVRQQDLPELGIGLGDIQAATGGPADLALIANQSAIAFVFPCAEHLVVPPRPEDLDGSCPLTDASTAPSSLPSSPPPSPPSTHLPDGSPAPTCTSSLASGDAGVPDNVYLMGGNLSEMFGEYVHALGRNKAGRNLRRLVVHFPVPGPNGTPTWQQRANPTSWVTQNLERAWKTSLGSVRVPVASIPAHSGPIDVYCGMSPPTPFPPATGCGCQVGSSESAWRGTVAFAMAMLLRSRRRRRT